MPQEFGLSVCILENQFGFILYHHVMEKQKDVDVAVSMILEAKRKFPGLSACSYDKGFYSRSNKQKLQKILDEVVLPKKGRLSEPEKQAEHSGMFIESRHQHAAVESVINALENHGLDGFKRYVALAVLSRNI